MVLVMALAGPAYGRTDQCITPLKNGSINWTTGMVTARGTASPQEKNELPLDRVPGAARADANRCLLDILKNIRIYNRLKVGEYAARKDTILAGVEATARDAVTIRQYYTSALDVELTIETSIFGGFLQLVLPEEIRQISDISAQVKPDKSLTPGAFTGLVIDARGLDFDPVLYPIILSEQGQEIYSAVFISREFAVQKGVARYTCSMESALTSPRIGQLPLIFKGLRKSGKDHSAIIINTADTQKIEKATERHTFLKECRVIIVLGEGVPKTTP